MIVNLGTLAFRMVRQPSLWLLLFLLPISGCDSCLGRLGYRQSPSIEVYRPDTPVLPRLQTPASPLGRPIQTPDAPHSAQSPESPAGRPASEIETEIALSQEKVDRIEKGMGYEQIVEVMGQGGVLIAGTDSTNSVYKWTLSGMNLMGRFENEVLVRSIVIYNEGESVKRREGVAHQYSQELYDVIRPGMLYEEVLELIGVEPEPLTEGADTVRIFKWTDSRGSSIIGRFENGILLRKSGRILGPEAEPGADVPKQEAVAPEIEYRFPITFEEEPDSNEDGTASTTGNESQQAKASDKIQESQVHIAGASRREREDESEPVRSYRPVARFPDFFRRIRRGDFEIRVHNRAITQLDVAVIADDQGLDMSIVSGGTASIFVGRGIYDMFYIYADDPFTLYEAQRLPVADTLADYVVEIFDDSYRVNYLDRNIEPSNRSRR